MPSTSFPARPTFAEVSRPCGSVAMTDGRAPWPVAHACAHRYTTGHLQLTQGLTAQAHYWTIRSAIASHVLSSVAAAADVPAPHQPAPTAQVRTNAL